MHCHEVDCQHVLFCCYGNVRLSHAGGPRSVPPPFKHLRVSWCVYRKFNLSPHIRYNENVVKTEKKTNYWYVHSDTSTLFKSRYLLVCTGPNQQPNLEILDQQLKGFTGAMYHSIMIKEFLTKYKDQRLLLIGGGETASDIVQEWLDQVKFIYWSIPNGQHFFRKFAKILPWKDPQALDKASSRLLTAAAPYHLSKPGLKWICKWTSNGSLLAYQGHGIPEWKNETPFFCQVINKNGKVLDSVDYKKLVPKGGIASCQGKKVAFWMELLKNLTLSFYVLVIQICLPPFYHKSTVRSTQGDAISMFLILLTQA